MTIKTSPKVTMIVTNYNHAKFLPEALESVKNQTYQNIQTIVVDDGSSDNSLEVLAAWIDKNPGVVAKQIRLNENRGKWYALNRAIEGADGELIALQDADDSSCPSRIERQVEALQQTNSMHNLCLFHHCYTQDDIDRHKTTMYRGNLPIMSHKETLSNVWTGFQAPGINHYYIGQNYEAHGASCLFYRQLWMNGMKFLPGNMGLRCQRAEDSDFNTKMTLLLQKTSILLEKQYLYRRNTSTNNAWLEGL